MNTIASLANPGMFRYRRAVALVLMFAVVFAVYVRSPVVITGDSQWVLHIAMSLIRKGDANLNEFRSVIRPPDYRVTLRDQTLVSVYPMGVPVLVAPALLILDQWFRVVRSFDFYAHLQRSEPDRLIRGAEKILACALTGLAAVFGFLIGCRCRGMRTGLLMLFIFAFCSAAWSTASRGLWQHGPSMLMLAVSLYLVLGAKERPHLLQYAGLVLGYAMFIRPTNIISALAFAVYVLVSHRRLALRFLCGMAVSVVPMALLHLAVFGSLMPWMYRLELIGLHGYYGLHPLYIEALAGNLISPARGLLICSPVWLFSLYGVLTRLGDRQFEALDWTVLAAIVLHWFAISIEPKWWAGHSYGPRYMSDVIPYFVYFLVPAITRMSALQGVRRYVTATLFAMCIGISFATHAAGATRWGGYEWNGTPVNVDEKPSRVWDWKDMPVLRWPRHEHGP